MSMNPIHLWMICLGLFSSSSWNMYHNHHSDFFFCWLFFVWMILAANTFIAANWIWLNFARVVETKQTLLKMVSLLYSREKKMEYISFFVVPYYWLSRPQSISNLFVHKQCDVTAKSRKWAGFYPNKMLKIRISKYYYWLHFKTDTFDSDDNRGLFIESGEMENSWFLHLRFFSHCSFQINSSYDPNEQIFHLKRRHETNV